MLKQMLVVARRVLRWTTGTNRCHHHCQLRCLRAGHATTAQRCSQETDAVTAHARRHSPTASGQCHDPARTHMGLRILRHWRCKHRLPVPVRRLQLATRTLHLHLLLRLTERRAASVEGDVDAQQEGDDQFIVKQRLVTYQ